MKRKFLFTTLGSLGDLHPYIAVALGLQARGHTVTVATSESYRSKIEGEGLRFHSLRPDLGALADNSDAMRRALHPLTGTEYVFRQLIMPWIDQSFEDTLSAARDADLIVGHTIAFTTPTVAELLRKPWISIALQPSVFLSAYDPPALSGAPFLKHFHALGPAFSRQFFRLAKRVAGRWGAPLNAMRIRLGLEPLRNPVLDDMYSPYGTQAWFSRLLAQPQKDWPARTTVTGFPFYDKLQPGDALSPDLAHFLATGPPPIVFTLGSTAVLHAGTFYAESLAAVQPTGHRAVLLIGRDPRNVPAEPLPATVHLAQYAPYSELLPRAAACVHSGGIGTTAQALRAGKPMIVVPFSNDQPDNAMRIKKLGVGLTLPRPHFRASRVARELNHLLRTQSYAAAAKSVAMDMSNEDGVAAACDGLESAVALFAP